MCIGGNNMAKKIIVDFDFIGYRKHLKTMESHYENKRDSYKTGCLIWTVWDAVVHAIHIAIETMDDYIIYEEEHEEST